MCLYDDGWRGASGFSVIFSAVFFLLGPLIFLVRSITWKKRLDVRVKAAASMYSLVFLLLLVCRWERSRSYCGSRLITFINQGGPFIRLPSIIAGWLGQVFFFSFLFCFVLFYTTSAISTVAGWAAARVSVWEVLRAIAEGYVGWWNKKSPFCLLLLYGTSWMRTVLCVVLTSFNPIFIRTYFLGCRSKRCCYWVIISNVTFTSSSSSSSSTSTYSSIEWASK